MAQTCQIIWRLLKRIRRRELTLSCRYLTELCLLTAWPSPGLSDLLELAHYTESFINFYSSNLLNNTYYLLKAYVPGTGLSTGTLQPISFSQKKKPKLGIIPLYRRENWGSENLGTLPEITKLVRGTEAIPKKACLTPRPLLTVLHPDTSQPAPFVMHQTTYSLPDFHCVVTL